MQQSLNRQDRHKTSGPCLPADFPQVELIITRGRAQNLVRRVQQAAFLIGTATDCDMVLGDPQFADVHACLLLRRGEVSIRHLGKGPDLTIDGRPVRKGLLQDNARIRTGPYEFRVRIRGLRREDSGGREGQQPFALFGSGEVRRNDLLPRSDVQLEATADRPRLFSPHVPAVSVGTMPTSVAPPPWPHRAKLLEA